MSDENWHRSETKPKKSGVYLVRATLYHHEDTEDPVSQTTGYAWFDKLRQRWGVLAATKTQAIQRKYTAGFAYNTDQKKEWKDS